MNFTEELTNWYNLNRRELPWRLDKDPYKVWLSEIILQQTRVEQGQAYFEKFLASYPGIRQMSAAPEEDILKLWQGLGYYNRAKNMHTTAKFIENELNGHFPQTAAELQKLKGVGPYTSAAISSIAFNEPIAAIDGNVQRVYSRFFGVYEPIDKPEGRKLIEELAGEYLNTDNPGDFNQSIMDFGSLVCKPKKADCLACPISEQCTAFRKQDVALLPVKQGKTKVKPLILDYFIMKHGDSLLVRRRDDKSIWKNLYDFPCVENDEIQHGEYVPDLLENWGLGKENIKLIVQKDELKHQLSHRSITALFWEVTLNNQVSLDSSDELSWIALTKLEELPLPRLIDKFWNNYTDGLK